MSKSELQEWVLTSYTGIDGLSLRSYSSSEPEANEVHLRVEAFSLNWGDMDLMQGRYSFNFTELPARIGCEAVGIVEKIGSEVSDIEIGKRYCTLPYFYNMNGQSAESITIDPKYLTAAPENLSAVEAASIWMQYLTAYYPIIELANAAPGVNILVTAATSTAGYSALNIGNLAGATMIGTTRFEHNSEYLKRGGADYVFVTSPDKSLSREVLRMTEGEGVHAVFDCIGAGMINEYSKALAKNAQIFFYGTLDENLPVLPMPELYQANATFKPYSLFNYVEDETAKRKGLDYVYNGLKSSQIKPNIDRIFSMSDYIEAWNYMRQPRNQHGKIVIKT